MNHEQLLKEKVVLLMARERELTALRKRHERASAWLAVAYGLPDMASALLPAKEIYERFAQSLVQALQLQAVCVYELADGDGLVAVREMGRLKRSGALGAFRARLVREHVAGVCNEPKDRAEGELAAALGLQRFLWYRLERMHGSPLLVTAGYDAERAVFYAPFDDGDVAHFTSLGHHLKVLLGNKALIGELEEDKRSLQEFNQTLEMRVEERTRELNDRNGQLAHTLASLREKEQRITDDLQQARAFQQSILPTLPRDPRISFYAYFRPLELVGGDIYDVCVLADGRFRIFMADATGHGVQASMRTVVLKAEYDRVKHALVGPGELLETFSHNVLTLYPQSEMLCTGCCVDVVLNAQGATVNYANGAQPALVRIAEGRVEEVYCDGPFLGLMPDAEVPMTTFELRVGHRLLIHTDGLSDQTNPGGAPFDLAGALVRAAERPLPVFVEEVVESLESFRAGRPIADDVTIVALELLGPV